MAIDMRIAASYKSINKRLQSEYLEPAWGWGLRVAVSVTAPLLWGILSGHQHEAEWMAIAAECVSFIDLKGNAGQRIRLLISAAFLSVLFCLVGSFAGNYLVLMLGGMMVVGFLSGLFKNLGDRGSGLALSVYIFYIITSNNPVNEWAEMLERCRLVAAGGGWTMLVSMLGFVFIRVGTPFRRTIAVIWKATAELARTTGKGWDGTAPRSSLREIYLKEKDVRAAIDASIYTFEETADQVSQQQKSKYNLTQSRKSAALVSLHIIQISEMAEQLAKYSRDRSLMIQIYSLFRVLEQLGERMEVFVLTLKHQERILVESRIERLRKIIAQLKDLPEQQPAVIMVLEKIAVQSERVAKLAERSLELLASPERRVFLAYSFTETLNILHPRYLRNNLRQLVHRNSLTTRYAFRIAGATVAGALIARLYFPDHGYWIPFTAIIVSQPYFGATLKKGIERSLGTVAGIVVGTGFLMLPFPHFTRVVLVFISSVLLIYFLKRQYSVATFFITLMLVGLLSIEPAFDGELMQLRIVCTMIGSGLAIAAGFILLPSWDKDMLPRFLAQAVIANFEYFRGTFYRSDDKVTWTKLKRNSETKNANAFDSFTRFMQEPVRRKKKVYANYYFLLTHNVRITRELNNFHSEGEHDEVKIPIQEKEKFIQLLYECDDLFRENAKIMRRSGNDFVDEEHVKCFPEEGFATFEPTESQYLYVEKMLIELKALHAGLTSS
jgi:uncharacterized membrane protein YccC